MSILELEELASIPDTLPYCPVKLAELMEFSAFSPVIPEPVAIQPIKLYPSRWKQYRVCGIDQVIRMLWRCGRGGILHETHNLGTSVRIGASLRLDKPYRLSIMGHAGSSNGRTQGP